MSLTPYPTLRLKLTQPQALKVQFLPAVPGFNASQAATKVSGPLSSTDEALARFNGTTGQIIQNSNATLDDAGRMTITAGSVGAQVGYRVNNTLANGELHAFTDGRVYLEAYSGDLRLQVDQSGRDIILNTNNGSVLCNSGIQERAIDLADGATVLLDAGLGNLFHLTALGNRSINVPINAPTPGMTQKLIIRHLASGAPRTLSLSGGAGGFRFGLTIPALTSTANGTTDYIGCLWNGLVGVWDVVAYAKGF